MIKVYAVSLALGVIGLAAVIFAGALCRPSPGETGTERTSGNLFKTTLGAVLGFAMGGMSAELSPLGLSWQVSLVMAFLAAAASVLWVRYALRRTSV